jgi:hypothetical protein
LLMPYQTLSVNQSFPKGREERSASRAVEAN